MGDTFCCFPSPSSSSLSQLHQDSCGLKSLQLPLAASLVRNTGCWGGRSHKGMEKVGHLLPAALSLPVGGSKERWREGRKEGGKKGQDGRKGRRLKEVAAGAMQCSSGQV